MDSWRYNKDYGHFLPHKRTYAHRDKIVHFRGFLDFLKLRLQVKDPKTKTKIAEELSINLKNTLVEWNVSGGDKLPVPVSVPVGARLSCLLWRRGDAYIQGDIGQDNP